MVDSPHGKGVTFTIRSAPVGYAAEYLTRGTFAPRIAPASRLGQRPRGICDSHGQISTHVYILHIIPFLGCLRLSVMLVSVDLHSEKPFFPLSSSIYIRFIRSHRPHTASRKHQSFLKVVLVLVSIFVSISMPDDFSSPSNLSNQSFLISINFPVLTARQSFLSKS